MSVEEEAGVGVQIPEETNKKLSQHGSERMKRLPVILRFQKWPEQQLFLFYHLNKLKSHRKEQNITEESLPKSISKLNTVSFVLNLHPGDTIRLSQKFCNILVTWGTIRQLMWYIRCIPARWRVLFVTFILLCVYFLKMKKDFILVNLGMTSVPLKQ